MINVDHLVKRYGGSTAVSDATFSCAPGTITGFLGPNGAGKSTTLRMLTGLTRPTSGTATIAGRHYSALPNPGRVIGVMLDAAAQHPGRSGREILRLSASVLGVSNRAADDMLERVGLTGAEGRLVRQYSLGMRQRLGIGAALLGDPAALVLDEPANGLDPEGIRWMRFLLQDFAARGGTVLLSSHLLREVEATADRLVVIGGGKIVAQGTLDELLGGAGVFARGLDDAALGAALTTAGLQANPGTDGGWKVVGTTEAVGRAAAASGLVLTELRESGTDGLEELFFTLTSNTDTESEQAA
jgi:ABC-2 type transport system ATP-binding protein